MEQKRELRRRTILGKLINEKEMQTDFHTILCENQSIFLKR